MFAPYAGIIRIRLKGSVARLSLAAPLLCYAVFALSIVLPGCFVKTACKI